MVMKVHLPNLAHDILKNNMENGNEFVSKFWKILPLALKDVMKHGDDRGKKAVSRWDSTRKTLVKELEKEGLVLIQCIEKHKVVEASRVILVSLLQDALYEQDSTRKTLVKELEKEGLVLIQCIEKHKVVEASRVILVSLLQDALYEQLAAQKLCILISIRFQGIYPYGNRIAPALAEEAANIWKHLNEEHITYSKASMASADTSTNPAQKTEKAAAAISAELADKLAASRSSKYILSSVLSALKREKMLGL
ncbi:Hypothetical predicted protein [Olea europaea subsp. europaea]|uniref:Uncharacterized protein n=1 Tax=Olea europaea subsp. europaea TaxID=158383 RepID=A0A8S0TYZ6_OLEEU|nr:Hypothetical predicted protein [Olea europaea subsp. europaea]